MHDFYPITIEALKTFDFKIALLVLIVYAVTDAVYAKYTLEITNCKPAQAATTGSLLHFLLAFGVISYTQNWLYIFPLAIGSWLGTYYYVKSEKNKNKIVNIKEV